MKVGNPSLMFIAVCAERQVVVGRGGQCIVSLNRTRAGGETGSGADPSSAGSRGDRVEDPVEVAPVVARNHEELV